MCNLYERHYRAWADYEKLMAEEALQVIEVAEEPPSGPVRPSDPTPVISATDGGVRVDLLKWGWTPRPPARGLVINVRSENRKDPPTARGLVLPDAFYEYSGDKAPKSQWRFTPVTNEQLAFAVVRNGGAYSLMTCEPGDDIRPIHGRQAVLLGRTDWRRWLTDEAWPRDLIRPSPAGSFRVEQTR